MSQASLSSRERPGLVADHVVGQGKTFLLLCRTVNVRSIAVKSALTWLPAQPSAHTSGEPFARLMGEADRRRLALGILLAAQD